MLLTNGMGEELAIPPVYPQCTRRGRMPADGREPCRASM
jgi:hypothetical protein